MSALLLYAFTTAAMVFAWSKWVRPISRAAGVALALIPLVFTGKALLTGRVYGPVDLPFMSEPLSDYARDYGITRVHNGMLSDLYAQMIPWRAAVRAAIANGEWPLLNPYMLCGDILASAAQPAPYDPFNLLSLLIDLPSAISYSAAMTFFAAVFFTFCFSRLTTRGEVASLVAGAAYAFCTQMAFDVGWPLGRAWALLPFILAGVRLVIDEPGVRSWLVLTLAFASSILAGHPETLLHVTAVGMLYALFALGTRANPFRNLRPIGVAIAAGVTALLLTAIFLLPFLDALQQTHELRSRQESAGTGAFATPAAIARRALSTFVTFDGGRPWFDGPNEWNPHTAASGSVVLVLALCGMTVRRSDRWFWAVLYVFCLAASLNAPPVAGFLQRLPLFNIALNERLGFAAVFSLALLAGAAVDVLAARRQHFAPLAAYAAVFFGFFLLTRIDSPAHAAVEHSFKVAMTAAQIVPIVLLVLVLVGRVQAKALAPLALALLLFERAAVDGSVYPAVPKRAFYPKVPILDAIPATDEPYRMVGLHFALIPDTAALYGLEDARGYSAMNHSRLYRTLPWWSAVQPISFNNVHETWRPFLDLANVRWAIGSRDSDPGDWRTVAEDRSTRLLENPKVLPRAFIPRRVQFARGFDALAAVEKVTDFRDLAVIEAEHSAGDAPNGSGTLRTRRDGLGLRIDASIDADSWVVISQTAWRGWRVYVDDRRVRPVMANVAFLGVHVPAGKHTLRLRYFPDSFARGRLISLATAALLVPVIFAISRRKRLRISA